MHVRRLPSGRPPWAVASASPRRRRSLSFPAFVASALSPLLQRCILCLLTVPPQLPVQTYEDAAASEREAYRAAVEAAGGAEAVAGSSGGKGRGGGDSEDEVDDGLVLPLSKIKRIMRLDPDISGVKRVEAAVVPAGSAAAGANEEGGDVATAAAGSSDGAADTAAALPPPPPPAPKPKTISYDVAYLLTAAAQVFIGALTQEAAAITAGRRRKQVSEVDLVSAIHATEALDFLRFDFPLSIVVEAQKAAEAKKAAAAAARAKAGQPAPAEGEDGVEDEEEEEVEADAEEEEEEAGGAASSEGGEEDVAGEEGGEGGAAAAPKPKKTVIKKVVASRGTPAAPKPAQTRDIKSLFAAAAAAAAANPRPRPAPDAEVAVVGEEGVAAASSNTSSSSASAAVAKPSSSSSKPAAPRSLTSFFSTLSPEAARAKREAELRALVIEKPAGGPAPEVTRIAGKKRPRSGKGMVRLTGDDEEEGEGDVEGVSSGGEGGGSDGGGEGGGETINLAALRARMLGRPAPRRSPAGKKKGSAGGGGKGKGARAAAAAAATSSGGESSIEELSQ